MTRTEHFVNKIRLKTQPKADAYFESYVMSYFYRFSDWNQLKFQFLLAINLKRFMFVSRYQIKILV